MKTQETKVVDLSATIKKRIYNEFHAILYKEFNQTVCDINHIFGYENKHLFEVLEEAFDKGGPNKTRNHGPIPIIDRTIGSGKLSFIR